MQDLYKVSLSWLPQYMIDHTRKKLIHVMEVDKPWPPDVELVKDDVEVNESHRVA